MTWLGEAWAGVCLAPRRPRFLRHPLSLRPVGLFAFLNVSLGDQAEMSERRCGCSLEAVGWTTHLRAIRSEEKLRSEEHTSELQSLRHLVCRLLLAQKTR